MSNNNELSETSKNDLADVFQEFVVDKIDFSGEVNKLDDTLNDKISEITDSLKPLNFIPNISDSMNDVIDFIDDNENLSENIKKQQKETESNICDFVNNSFEKQNEYSQINKNSICELIKESFENQKNENASNKNNTIDLIKEFFEKQNECSQINKDSICELIKESFENQKNENANNKNNIIDLIKELFDKQMVLYSDNNKSILMSISESEDKLISKCNDLEKQIVELKENKKKKIIKQILMVIGILLQVTILILILIK